MHRRHARGPLDAQTFRADSDRYGAMALTPICVAWLNYFIHHISNAISVNHIVDRIARETELVIDELMPERRRPILELPPTDVVPEGLELVIASRILIGAFEPSPVFFTLLLLRVVNRQDH